MTSKNVESDINRKTTGTHTAPRKLGDVLVVGLGKSGKAVARYCLDLIEAGSARIKTLTIYGGAATDEARAFAAPFVDRGCEVVFDTENIIGSYTIAVMSPGIPSRDPFYRAAVAAADEVMSEPEFAYRESPERWVAVTGTNGKTTTTALTAHLLNTAGIPACAVGNIGDTCIAAVADRPAGQYLVAELSSYQLASVSTFKPVAATLLNITPDHLHWHGTHQAYASAKAKLFNHMDAQTWAVLDVSTPETEEIARTLAAHGVAVCTLGNATGIRGTRAVEFRGRGPRGIAALDAARDMLRVTLGERTYKLVAPEELQITGDHNVENALAASTLALALGAPLAQVREGLRSFAPLEHRNEPCGQVDGVSFFNDSKATNTDATLKALGAFGDTPLIMLYGGDDKGTDLTELVDATLARCKAVVCYGAACDRFLASFEEGRARHIESACEVLSAEHLADALDTGFSRAQAGDAVCLSPACASFDEFNSFEHRGEVFKEMVAGLSRS